MPVELQVVDLPVKGRAADTEAPGGLGHAAAIEGEGPGDRLRFDVEQPPDMAVAGQEGVGILPGILRCPNCRDASAARRRAGLCARGVPCRLDAVQVLG